MPSEVVFAFRASVKMTADEIEAWMEAAESRLASFIRPGNAESAG